MAKSNNTLRDIILRSGLVDEMQMKSAIAKQQQWGGSICKTLTDMGWVAEDTLIELLGKELRMPVMHLGNWAHDAQALSRLDVDFCDTYGVFPMSLKNRALTLAMYDPTDIATVDEAMRRADARVIPVLVSETEIRNAILKHYRKQQPRTESNKALKAIKRMRHETKETEVPLELQTIGNLSEPISLPNEQDFDEGLAPVEADGFSTEDLGRIEAARLHQEKTASILRAVTQLLQEKGLLKNRRR